MDEGHESRSVRSAAPGVAARRPARRGSGTVGFQPRRDHFRAQGLPLAAVRVPPFLGRPYAAWVRHAGGTPEAVQLMPRPPYDPIALNYLLATGWDRGSCPLCWTTLAAHVGGDTLTTTIAWACASCGEFELSRDAADLLDRIRRSDPARSRRVGAAVSRHLDELSDPITTVAILRLESRG